MSIKASTVKGGTTLVVIDGQIDFHPGGGSLPVAGADEDAKRIAALIRSSVQDDGTSKITRIVATMDSHHPIDISHHRFWKSEDGKHPDPFTIISSEDIENGTWVPCDNIKMPVGEKLVDPEIFKTDKELYDADGNLDLLTYCIEYAKKLEEGGKLKICIWPDHCLIGSSGHCLEKNIEEAFLEWSDATGSSIEFLHKGQNILTEMYSALKAEVELTKATQLNHTVLDSIRESDHILVCGQALSHCVSSTTIDMIDNMSGEEHKVMLLEDCASSVGGFESVGEEFKKYVKEKGGKVCVSTTVLDEL
eukprot:CAMPEP_0204614680 /NCGR_PEP_ID=MMETSP0717-20131115/2337_1 /ASSEMBLY_ACC=CAM_ASM_000666 /TAXON_ID=230516 /ORGANISM="Chaetoceros curvisetus" /LENGTH=305 /DNA_ID=CAMNT_0051627401 /DNA_START=328 /DNA_END=1245 /DNA_ORIENTATION=+